MEMSYYKYHWRLFPTVQDSNKSARVSVRAWGPKSGDIFTLTDDRHTWCTFCAVPRINTLGPEENGYHLARNIFHVFPFRRLFSQNIGECCWLPLGREQQATCPVLQWRHNEREGVLNYQRLDYLLDRVCRRKKQTKHQCSASLAFVRGIHRGPANSPHKRPVTRKKFAFDNIIMWFLVSNLFTHLRCRYNLLRNT